MFPRLLIASLAALSACKLPAPPPSPDELGNRLRVLVTGREVESITTADYFLFLMVRAPDGTRTGINTYVPGYGSSGGMALGISVYIERRCDLPDLELIDKPGKNPVWCDIVLPKGYSLCLEPGSHYAYRIVDHGPTMAADLNAEIHLLASSKDGTRYYEVAASDGPVLKRAATPPGWPLPPTR